MAGLICDRWIRGHRMGERRAKSAARIGACAGCKEVTSALSRSRIAPPAALCERWCRSLREPGPAFPFVSNVSQQSEIGDYNLPTGRFALFWSPPESGADDAAPARPALRQRRAARCHGARLRGLPERVSARKTQAGGQELRWRRISPGPGVAAEQPPALCINPGKTCHVLCKGRLHTRAVSLAEETCDVIANLQKL